MLGGILELQMLTNLARFSADMTSAKGMVTGAVRSMESSVNSLKSAFGALGIGLSVAGFGALVKGSIDAMDHLNDLSKTTKLTVETLAGLKVAALQSGGDVDSIAQSINKLSVEMGKAPQKFKELGITAKDPLEAFKQFADIFNRLEEPQQRAAVAAAALGKAWAGAAPLLSEGSQKIGEMIETGAKYSGVTKEMAEQADALNDKWVLLVSSGHLVNSIVGEALPLMNFLADDMLKAADKTSGLTKSFSPLLETMKVLIVLASDVSFAFQTIGKDIARAIENVKLIAKGDFAGSKALGEMFKKDAEEARRALDIYQRQIMNFGQATTSPTPGGPGGGLGGRNPAADAAAQADAARKAAEFLNTGKEAAAEQLKLAHEIAAFNEHVDQLEMEQIKKSLEAGHDRYLQEKKDTLELAQLASELEKNSTEAKQRQLEAAQGVRDDFVEKQQSDLKALTESLMSETEMRKFAYERDFNMLNDTLGMKADRQSEYYTLLGRLAARNAYQEKVIEMNKHAVLRSMQIQTFQLGVELLQQFAGESKAAAIAVIVISKALAIAQVIHQTAIASMAAFAPPPIGLGPLAGGALAARIQALGAIQIGLIAATGLIQASQVGGGGADPGTPANPINTTPGIGGGDTSSTTGSAAGPSQTTIIHLHGESYSRKQVKELVEKINENQRDGGRIVFA